MSILLVVQAGYDGSNRRDMQMLPFAGTTVLGSALKRLSGYTEGPVIVATSDLSVDQEIEGLARANSAATVRGPSDDILARFVEVIADYPAEHLVRVKANSPFIDKDLVNQAVASHLESGADYTSNTLLRTFPTGLEVEVIRSDALLDAAEQATTEAEREGVTTFVTRRPATYALNSLIAPGDYEDHDWVAYDTSALDRLNDVVNKAGGDLTKPWDQYLPFDKPHIPNFDVRLRTARQNVAEALPNLSETLGHPPDPLPLSDASRRSFGVWADDSLIGAITLSVQNGWGTFAGNFAPGLEANLADETLSAVDRYLLDDDQVLALTIDGSKIRQYRE